MDEFWKWPWHDTFSGSWLSKSLKDSEVKSVTIWNISQNYNGCNPCIVLCAHDYPKCFIVINSFDPHINLMM